MARFEGALAIAAAKAGIVPAGEAETIARVCARFRLEPATLARAARRAGTLAIPFVNELTKEVAAESAEAARYVHFGATSQDVIDTALVLCLRPAANRIAHLVRRLGDAAASLAERHAETPMAGRTLLQAALPIPFGWKAAVWLSMLCRALPHFERAAQEACALQLGGASGTLSAFGAQASAMERALAEELRLQVPLASWHSARDGFARLGSEAAILAGVAGKIARDVSLLMQPEVGEVAEAAAGGSSSMPHKRNPSGSVLALEASQRVPGLVATLLAQLTPEHERGLGQWQSQWLTLRELLCAAASALSSMVEVLESLTVNTDAMRSNLERSRGLVFSEAVSIRLSSVLGKSAAHALTEKLTATALREAKTLLEVMTADVDAARAVPPKELAGLFDPSRGFDGAGQAIQRVLHEWRRSRTTSPERAP
jgi:3-carboxy-cis,cis-muconate cycloisomerase